MVFITTGQRIATENFSDGVIYKVTFVNATISYMMCVGIGQDFVMLQGPNPSLFCLTMSSASRVSTIDVHDPTPPEPPTPIENALQYQTGEPPFTFTTTASSLFSWYLEGPCGVKTANLSVISGATDTIINNYYKENRITNVPIEAGEYTFSFTFNNKTEGILIGSIGCGTATRYARDVINYQTPDNPMPYTIIKTFTLSQSVIDEYGGYIWVRFARAMTSTNFTYTVSSVMLNSGSTALPFEPHGFKISILSNDNAETIYLDEALAEGERLYSVNNDTVIATDIGENTLSVTPTPPEMQIVYGIYAEA